MAKHTTLSRAPAAALSKKDESDRKIKLKKSVLREFIKNGVPFCKDKNGNIIKDENGAPMLDYYPKSLSAIASWKAENHCKYNVKNTKNFSLLSSFDRNKLSDPNRKGSSRLKEELKELLSQLKERVKLQIDNSRLSDIDKLTNEIEILKLQNKSLKESYIETKVAEESIREMFDSTNDEFKRIEKELKSQIDTLSTEKKALTAQVSSITKSLYKVTTIKSVKKS